MPGKNPLNRFLSLFTDTAAADIFTDDELSFVSYCISHTEERESFLRDQFGNWEFPFTSFDYKTPYVDKLILSRLEQQGIKRKRIWKESPFAFCITHDVDTISTHSPVIKARRYQRTFQYTSGFFDKLRHKQVIYRNQALSIIKKWDAADTGYFDFFIEAEKKFGYRSAFNIFIHPEAGYAHRYDCDYMPDDLCVFENKLDKLENVLQKLVQAGFEIGLHGSYLSHADARLLVAQKKKLENMVGKPVLSGRQHYLHFDLGKTPAVLMQSGIKVDTSMGFNRSIGYRAGTSMPYFLNDNLLELPMIIMDCSLFREDSMGLDLAGAKHFIIQCFDWAEKAGGCLTINYHSDAFKYSLYRESYLFCLEEANKRNACNMTPSEIYTHLHTLSGN